MTDIVNRQDSDGYAHEICAQQHPNSCAMASIFMIECILKQASMAGGEERLWYFSSQMPGHLTGSSGTTGTNMLKVLKRAGIFPIGWDSTDVDFTGEGQALRPDYIGMRHPALVIVGWWGVGRGGWQRFGGHAVVARWMTDERDRIVYLDPYKGQLVERLNYGQFHSLSGEGLIEAIFYF